MDVNIFGTVGKVEILASGIEVMVKGAIDSISVSGTNSTLIIDRDSTVNTLDISQGASNANISVSGTIKHMTISASEAEVKGTGTVTM